MDNFEREMQQAFLNQRVRVVARDGETYTGWVQRMDFHNRHFLLTGCADASGPVLVSHAERVEALDGGPVTIDRVPLSKLHPHPFAWPEFDYKENAHYISDVASSRRCFERVTVWATDEGYQIIDGHKAAWVREQAGLQSAVVEVLDVSKWAADAMFVADHLPLPDQVRDGDNSQSYDDDAVAKVVRDMLSHWGDRALDLGIVAYNADRLGIDPATEVPADD